MGRYIQIRVSASTFAPDEAEKSFPRLYAAAWPAPEYSPADRKGLLELVDQLGEMTEFGDMPKEAKAVLHKELPAVAARKREVEAALADWKPAEAENLSSRLEEALADLEARMPAA
ncbi:hypothetical protein dsx2_0681 [Desulfovibrio sp. X2]|uniref:hypothetical protein n=1 Tax=Desulfovibrio sp. X2 TaxID=941449 RepID=UPI0003587391|nr:hypothetical protein [Desulfovibrio sp. X2]EPR37335.1 hypothetical protein dsx2_0681 [Desulfovibrio sp. X2]